MANAFSGINGKKLVGIAVEEGEQRLMLAFDDDTYQCVAVEGDCCSWSFWYEIIGAKGCYGATITGVRVLDMPDPDQDGYDHLQAYGYALDTTMGTIRFVFRNESNGYYGGWAFNTEDSATEYPKWKAVDSNDWTA